MERRSADRTFNKSLEQTCGVLLLRFVLLVAAQLCRCAGKLTIRVVIWSSSVRVHNLKIYYVLDSGIHEFPNVSLGCS